jgi:EAL domain-containing protein (putative c-di-GMP-specific phosphodiesterase class I)
VTLELTERTLLEDRPEHGRALHALDELGVEIALDDFGTGYSALGVLAGFPLSLLKLDRAFVRPLPQDARGLALVKGIVAMADGLGLETVAEGIETEQQREALTAAGCTLAQGYLFSRPVTAADFGELVRACGY